MSDTEKKALAMHRVFEAAMQLAHLRAAQREAQHTGLGRLSSPLPSAPSRADIIKAERALDVAAAEWRVLS